MSPITTTTMMMMMMMMLMMMMMIHHKLQQHQQTSTYIKINYDSTSNIVYYNKVKNKQHPKTENGFCNHKHGKKNQTFCLVLLYNKNYQQL
jgi:hypothetical protein